MRRRFTAFAWGYKGWGEAPERLKRLVDALERSRGFRPPLFVDVRVKRAVRAKAFQGATFQRQIGRGRYHWLQGLGNDAVRTGRGRKRLKDPGAVARLLELIKAASRQRRRVIFFCSCSSPEEAGSCHRRLVTKLLLQRARKQKVRLVVDEWPGGEPNPQVGTYFTVATGGINRVLGGKMSVRLARRTMTGYEYGFPVGSLVRITEGGRHLVVSAKPPYLRAGVWTLGLLVPAKEGASKAWLLQRARAARRRLRIDAKEV